MLRIIIEFDGREGGLPRIEMGDLDDEAAAGTESLSAGPAPDFTAPAEMLPVEDSFDSGAGSGADDGTETEAGGSPGLAAAGASAAKGSAQEKDDGASGQSGRK